jgi:N6-adenosine-specific RNA methylase IME4
MPFEFDKFSYESPKVPTQMDSDNCGVFCMKFLAEWGTEVQSFKGWTKLKKIGDNSKVGRITDLRIEICSAILSHPSNSIRYEVQMEATTFIEENCQKLPSSSVRNH